MANPVIHDFVILVYVYLRLIKSHGIKQSGIDNLHWLFNERMLKHKEYFQKQYHNRKLQFCSKNCQLLLQ